MTTTKTTTPAQAPDAQPVTADFRSDWTPCSREWFDDLAAYRSQTGETPVTDAIIASERDGYRQALETEKALRAADVRVLRAALERVVYCLSFHVEVDNRGVGSDAEYLRQGRAALQMARDSRGAK